ncbi:hypothetical protein ACFS5J_04620 [Flavobacterium chuncheonense]|uniref:Uncharacterized protein n=1 Tax=Flavobacterium chuncheonense TaxID=2026653 RepID=A0ABW5YLK2_9FLAO
MQLRVKIVLILFLSFLATPTLLSSIDSDIDTSYFYNLAEEEENHVSFNEIKMLPILFSIPEALKFTFLKKDNFSICNVLKFTNWTNNIFLPPPERV